MRTTEYSTKLLLQQSTETNCNGCTLLRMVWNEHFLHKATRTARVCEVSLLPPATHTVMLLSMPAFMNSMCTLQHLHVVCRRSFLSERPASSLGENWKGLCVVLQQSIFHFGNDTRPIKVGSHRNMPQSSFSGQ